MIYSIWLLSRQEIEQEIDKKRLQILIIKSFKIGLIKNYNNNFMIKTSIIVISYNNSHNLEQCLISLTNQNYDRNIIDLEIIVVDSGSTDNSIEILKRYNNKIKIILKPSHLPRFSPAIARNTGANNSNGDILIFSDGDCIPPLNWVKSTVNSFIEHEIDCAIGNRDPDVDVGTGTFIRRYNFILYSNKFTIPEPIIINSKSIQDNKQLVFLAANNFAIKRKIWNEFGGMKSIFKNPSCEDLMLESEIIKSNYNIYFNPHVKVRHLHPISLKSVFRKAIYHGEGNYFLNKYSDGVITWKHLVERGDMLDPKYFFFSIAFFVLFLAGALLLKIPFFFWFNVLLSLFLTIFLIDLFLEKRRLESILAVKGEKYAKQYALSVFRVGFFKLVNFFLKLVNSTSFLWHLLITKR